MHQWVKKAVLLSFRLNDMEVITGPKFSEGQTHWYDKVPSKFVGWDAARFKEAGVRAVPGAMNSYPNLGWQKVEDGWVRPRGA